MCISMENLCYVLLITLVGNVHKSVADCVMNSGEINKFGPNCEYMCHCSGGGACDHVTGDCENGCDKQWFGTGCQFRELAVEEVSRHLDNINPPMYSDRANDGYLDTCSYTNISTTFRTRNPWWRVWLPRNNTIWSMEFVTTAKALKYFRGFVVTVEYVPKSQAINVNYYPPERQLCYKHSSFILTSKKIHVTCDEPLEGNQVRIELASTNTQLVLCDVKINGGRNMAFGKHLAYSSARDITISPPSNAVDGVVQYKWEYCFVTDILSQHDWIAVDLGHLSFISSIRLYARDQYLKNYKLLVSNTTGESNAIMVHDDSRHNTPTTEVTLDVTGQYVNISRRSSSNSVTEICEIEIYGDCVPGFCGYNCSTECHCKAIEDRLSGNCKSGCEGRWTGQDRQCLTKCGDFQWGTNCSSQCGKCNNSEPCDVVTGYCPFGCTDGYFDTELCDIECENGTYGENCSSKCSGNCIFGNGCRKADGYCTEGCKAGFTGDKCNTECPTGTYGMNCSRNCSAHCLHGDSSCHHVNGTCLNGCISGWEGQMCDTECGEGYWHQNCKKECGNCLSETCNRYNGHCQTGCAAGFKKTNDCTQECENGRFGINCASSCSYKCQDVCNNINGTCRCRSGWKGLQCDQECEANEWGESCQNNCGMCLIGTCDRFSGKCSGGCMPGFKTTDMCTEECLAGTYGQNCSGVCSANCKVPNKCRNVDGDCKGCKAGKQGDQCTEDCNSGNWGEDCLHSCGACARNETCTITTGHCIQGCSRGYKHSQLCSEECDDGTHGDNCTSVCGKCKPGTVCNKVTGMCLAGCADGFKPNVCLEALPQKGTFPVGGVVGGVVAAVVAIALVLFVLVFLRRRKMNKEKQTDNNTGFGAIIAQDQEMKRESQKHENVYINSVDLQTESKSSREFEPEDIILSNQKRNMQDRSFNQKKEVSDQLEDDCADVYYNEGAALQRKTEHSVNVTDLEAYVKKRITEKSFSNEFEMLPLGLQHPTSVAKKVGNIGKNRYKALYAYDHSRVILKTLPDLPDSDYINASKIKGYSKDDAYIASQGPTEFNIDEFWRMIWEKDVHTIVMTTRIVEDTKMKCLQYWAEVEQNAQYGPINVLTESEDVYAEFKIRRLNVSHEDEPSAVRHVTQFHYIAWPDKDVPRSTSSLLHFWYKVRKNDEEKSHPWLVHCSAGVGRTGTFIAIDILYDQGKEQGSVDVFQCVKDLREQRVSMVQTKEQYRYVYSVLVEALVLPSKPIHVDEVPGIYNELQDIDKLTGKTKLLVEYETLLEETDSGSDVEDIDEMYTSAKHTENRNKNRFDNILAPNDYRPFLSTQVKGCTNYINAVYIPSYIDAHGYIITQTPLMETAIDCCRLMFEQEVSVLVTFEESTDEEVGIYLPDSGNIKVGPFTLKFVSVEDRGHCKIKNHKLYFDSKEHSFTQIVYKQWTSKQATPSDPSKMLDFLQQLECIQRQNENKPVMAQCLNGAERSGLIVVLMNIMERVRLDNEVSIPQVIRQLRLRRQQIIPNFEQFKFCYDVLHSHVESSATYANV